MSSDGQLNKEELISSLEFIRDAIGSTTLKPEEEEDADDLSELSSEAVPEEVRKWLASTFAKQEQVIHKKDEHPTFRSVANAIRTGIFIEKIYRRMSTSQLMVMPADLDPYLAVSQKCKKPETKLCKV